MTILRDNYFGCIAAMTALIAANVYSGGLSPPHYRCSSRPDGLCPRCDGRPDCFDLSDEISCDLWARTVFVAMAPDKCDAVSFVCLREFLPPPPIPPFPLCDKRDTTSPRSTTTDHITPRSTTTDHKTPRSTTTDQITPRSTTTDHITPRSTTTNHITPKSTTTDHITPRSTTTDHISPRSTTTDHIFLRSTTTDHISPRSTTTDHITPRSTTTASYRTTNYDRLWWIMSPQTFPPTWNWPTQTRIFATPQQWNDLWLLYMVDAFK